jgi:hypothetical protein
MLWRLAALLCVGIGLAACGSGSKSSSTTTSTTAKHGKAPITVSNSPAGPTPRATEPLSGFVMRLTVAAHDITSGKCAPVAAFGKTSNLILPCNAQARKQFAGFKVTGSATYGTGAVVEFTDADVASKTHVTGFSGTTPTKVQNTGFYPLALSKTGRYIYVPAGAPPVFPGSYIGSKPNGWAGADAEAVRFLTAVRDNNCAAWFKNVITPNGMPQKTACQLGLIKASAALRQALNSGQPVELSREDGNAVFYYYALTIGKTSGTLGIARDQPPAPPFIAVGTTQSPPTQ